MPDLDADTSRLFTANNPCKPRSEARTVIIPGESRESLDHLGPDVLNQLLDLVGRDMEEPCQAMENDGLLLIPVVPGTSQRGIGSKPRPLYLQKGLYVLDGELFRWLGFSCPLAEFFLSGHGFLLLADAGRSGDHRGVGGLCQPCLGSAACQNIQRRGQSRRQRMENESLAITTCTRAKRHD